MLNRFVTPANFDASFTNSVDLFGYLRVKSVHHLAFGFSQYIIHTLEGSGHNVVTPLGANMLVGQPLSTCGLLCACRYNDRNYKWVAYDTWTFQTEFNASEDILDQQKVDLVLNGVDTVAEIYVNDKLVVETHNAHRCC